MRAIILSKGNSSQEVLRNKDVSGKCVQRVAGKKGKGGVHIYISVLFCKVGRILVVPG